jgi:hypothetical protein
VLGVDPLAPARVGHTVMLTGRSLRFGQPAATLLLGLSNQTWGAVPLPFGLDFLGMTGCSLLVSADFVLTSGISAAGEAAWSIALPEDRGLLNAHFYGQILAPDPGVTPAGFVVSRGLDVAIGW